MYFFLVNLFFALTILVTENSGWTVTTSEFSNINYCGRSNSEALVNAACENISSSYSGTCAGASVTLTDAYSVTSDLWNTIGLCYSGGVYQYCVTDDTDSASDLLVWNYSNGRCSPSSVKSGKGSAKISTKKSKKKDDDYSGAGGSGGDYAIGIPVGYNGNGKTSSGRGGLFGLWR